MAASYILIFVIGFLIYIKLYVKYNSKRCKNKVCLIGKTVVITGANSGIGYETALELAKRGAKVILACRDQIKGSQARDQIIKETTNPNIDLVPLNLASLQSVKKCASDLLKNEEKIDILVNNAGAGGLDDNISEDGLQILMQINHIGPFLFTNLLLELLKKSPNGRVVTVSSVAAKYSKFKIDKVNAFDGLYSTYANSKLCNILFTKVLASRLHNTNITCYSLHPGAVRTEIFRRITGLMNILFQIVAMMYFKSSEEGAQTSIYLATEQNIEQYSGQHFNECEPVTYTRAENKNLQTSVWDTTESLLMTAGLLPAQTNHFA